MSQTSNSPKRVAEVAYRTAQAALPRYGSKFSPKKFTQPQVAACLVLKEFFKTDYRGIVAILADHRELREILEWPAVPHWTTLHKASRTVLKPRRLRRVLATLVEAAQERSALRSRGLVAMDGTGLESHHVSAYFVRRRAATSAPWQTMTYQRYPKVGLIADCASHLILAGVPGRGPSFDGAHAPAALAAATRLVPVRTLVADAGYDSEAAHVLARETYGIRTLIPPRHGRPTAKPPRGHYRRLMTRSWNPDLYGQRWQVETVVSRLKRNLGAALRARTYWSQGREILLRILTHHVMIVPLRYAQG
jgi:hypothetical protein